MSVGAETSYVPAIKSLWPWLRRIASSHTDRAIGANEDLVDAVQALETLASMDYKRSDHFHGDLPLHRAVS